jgi:hypothetical protein
MGDDDGALNFDVVGENAATTAPADSGVIRGFRFLIFSDGASDDEPHRHFEVTVDDIRIKYA